MYHHHEPVNNCCTLPQNQLSSIRSSLIIHDVSKNTGAAHEMASSHYTVDIKHVDEQDTRYQ
jgi:hypothetical protein